MVDADDELFVVVDTRLLEAILSVFDPIDSNALICAESGDGVHLKTRTENCHYLETHIGTTQLHHFRPDDVNRKIEIAALERVLSRTPADRVAFHASTSEELLVCDGIDEYDVSAAATPLDDDHNSIMEVGKIANKIECTLESSRFLALIDANSTHDHVRIAADTAAERLEVGVYDSTEGVSNQVLSVSGSAFLESPAVSLGTGDAAIEQLVCAEAIDEAMPPMRGPVTLGFASGPESGVNFEYERADGAVTVWALLGKREGASITDSD